MNTRNDHQRTMLFTLFGSLALGAFSLVLATAVVMGGLAFLAPIPLVVFGVPSVLLFRRARSEFSHDESTSEGREA